MEQMTTRETVFTLVRAPSRPSGSLSHSHAILHEVGATKGILTLNWMEWSVLLRSSIAVCYVRVSLWILPFSRVLRSVERLATRPASKAGPSRFTPDQFAWAVEALSKRALPDRPCLTQALALMLLLRRHGYPAELRIGVRPCDDARLDAHAWIESEGRVLIGRIPDLAEYAPLPRLESFVRGSQNRT
jgi:hypothetical protein